MSYILDALKKADDERERGQLPGLHTRPLQTAPRVTTPIRITVIGLASAGVVIAVAGAWWWSQSSGAARVPVATVSPDSIAHKAADARPTVPASSLASLPAPARPSEGVAKSVAALSPPAAAEQNVAAAPVAAASVPERPSDATKGRAQRAPAQITALSAPPSLPRRRDPSLQDETDNPSLTPAQGTDSKPDVSRARPKPDAGPTAASITELSPAVRQGIPKLTISGATYSENPAWRMVIINGQVFKEGEKPMPDLQLEQIRPKAAVLSYKGQRFSVAY